MKRQRIFALLLSAVILATAATSDAFSAEKTPTWGWKEDEGASAPHKPRPAPAQNAWQAKTATPAPDPASLPKVEPPAKAAQSRPPTVKSYCENIADPALDARFLHQKGELTHLEEELAKKTVLLESRRSLSFKIGSSAGTTSSARPREVLSSCIRRSSQMRRLFNSQPWMKRLRRHFCLNSAPSLQAPSSTRWKQRRRRELVSVMIGAARPSDKAATPEKDVPRNASAEQPNGTPQEAGKPRDNGKS